MIDRNGKYPVIPDERGDDLHGLENIEAAELVIFMAGNQFMAMYRQVGGDELMGRIMETKRKNGETLLTTVHHRETPERIVSDLADAGPVWATEIEHARRSGLALEGIEVGPRHDQHRRVKYYACPLKTGAHPENGQRWLAFLTSPEAQNIYRSCGFTSP